jgi:putative DNA primase/helicase
MMPIGEKQMIKIPTSISPGIANEVYRFNLTDAGNAEAFVKIYGDKLRYVHGIGWHLWNGTYWQPDETKEIMRLVKELSKHRQMAISQFEADPDKKLEKLRLALKLEQAYGAKNCLEFAQSLEPFSCSTNALDRDPESLACSNGTLYPEFGALIQPDPVDLITKCVNVAYSEDAKAPRWLRFLEEVFTDQNEKPDYELIKYIRKALGYCLTGYTNERCLLYVMEKEQMANQRFSISLTILWAVIRQLYLLQISQIKAGKEQDMI